MPAKMIHSLTTSGNGKTIEVEHKVNTCYVTVKDRNGLVTECLALTNAERSALKQVL